MVSRSQFSVCLLGLLMLFKTSSIIKHKLIRVWKGRGGGASES